MADPEENFDAAFLEAAPEPPRRRRSRGLSVDEIDQQYPSLKSLQQPSGQNGRSAWVAVFNARPDVMHNLLADYIKQVHAQPGRIGQRPMPKEEEVDFHSLVYGEENELPLVEALPKIMRHSIRETARRCSMSKSQMMRILQGEYVPNVKEMRLLAAACRKPPTFFVEYRKAMILAALINLLDERPVIATKLYRQYLDVRMGD